MAGSHKREANARFVPRAALVAAPVAILATASVVTLGVAQSASSPPSSTVLEAKAASADIFSLTSGRSAVVSRSSLRQMRNDKKAEERQIQQRIDAQNRVRSVQAAAKAEAQAKVQAKAAAKAEATATAKAVAGADTVRWVTVDLNVWDAADESARQIGTLEKGAKVTVTGRAEGGRAEIVLKDQSRWVSAGHFSDEKPAAGIGGTCTNGTSVASWVSPRIKAIHESVCARFPSISVYGTRTGAGDHGTGRAVDIMLSGPIGWEVAEYLKQNYQAFGISYLIYEQQIWSVERGGEGWRGMSSRGSVTANHFDHVHVSVF